ncbi:hypothetical protein ACFQU1_25610 [Chelatococcus sp. GCM10030263]|uniref:hypothetical protein n=1 Tax=Chelatococcus sp. GCM10030263 TaxID=3273387 RepID=UPI00360CF5E6
MIEIRSRHLFTHGLSWAGFVSGPGAWALSTQVNYMLAPWECAHRAGAVPWAALLLALVALPGGLLSWRAWQRPEAAGRPARTERFIAGVSLAMAVLFALVILLQGTAGLVFNGCER